MLVSPFVEVKSVGCQEGKGTGRRREVTPRVKSVNVVRVALQLVRFARRLKEEADTNLANGKPRCHLRLCYNNNKRRITELMGRIVAERCTKIPVIYVKNTPL
jgi:hypothetical protein